MDDATRLGREIVASDTVVALTGAGISAPSGVPTFRGEDGVWDRFEREDFSYGRFRRDPAGFWRDRLELQRAMFGGEYEPNAAHLALAELACERESPLDAIVTQNVDGLHADAADAVGDRAVDLVELHGNATRVRCTDCGRTSDAEPVFERARGGEIPPRCDCGGVLKPDVVLFGERLPAGAMQRARTLALESDAFLAIGSSLAVEPAASLPRVAARNGATLAVVNRDETPCDDAAAFVVRDDVATVLPRLRTTVLGAGNGE